MTRPSFIYRLNLATIALLLSVNASAETSSAPAAPLPASGSYPARLAATCANCHGTAGQGVGQRLPRLAGQSEADLLASLKGYKDGTRPGTVMPQISKGYSEAQLALLARYFAAQRNN